MSIIKKPFTIIFKGDIARPYLPITIKNPKTGQQMRTFGLIDTGADECAFPATYASLTGHDLLSGSQKEIITGNGKTVAYTHTVSLEVNDYSVEKVLVDFMPNLHIGLLGVKNFLKNFILTVDYTRQNFSLEKK